MQEGPLLMTQADRDRLVALKIAKKKLITQMTLRGAGSCAAGQQRQAVSGMRRFGHVDRFDAELRFP